MHGELLGLVEKTNKTTSIIEGMNLLILDVQQSKIDESIIAELKDIRSLFVTDIKENLDESSVEELFSLYSSIQESADSCIMEGDFTSLRNTTVKARAKIKAMALAQKKTRNANVNKNIKDTEERAHILSKKPSSQFSFKPTQSVFK